MTPRHKIYRPKILRVKQPTDSAAAINTVCKNGQECEIRINGQIEVIIVPHHVEDAYTVLTWKHKKGKIAWGKIA